DCGLARSSSGEASAAVALLRHFASSTAYTPCLRHHALCSASFIAAVSITAPSRAAAVQVRLRAGLDCVSFSQRSSVPAETPTSPATASSEALSGGSNRATALSLKACPYRATSLSPFAPEEEVYRDDNYSDAGGLTLDLNNREIAYIIWLGI